MSNGDCQPTRDLRKKVRFKIIQNIMIRYHCPWCHKENTKEIYGSLDDEISLQCDYCGKYFIGE